MELTVDIGTNVHDDLVEASKIEGKNLQSTASAMLALGVKVYLSSKENQVDPATSLLLKNSVKSNEILIEILHAVFDKEKSKLGVYDADTAVALSEKIANKFMEGAG